VGPGRDPDRQGGRKGGGFAVRSLDGREVQHRQQLQGVASSQLLVREGDCLRVIDLGSAFRTAAFGCITRRTYQDPSGGTLSEDIRPVVALSSDGARMMVDGVAVHVATLARHGTLMPVGIYRTTPTFGGLDPAHVLGRVWDSEQHMIAAIVCDLPRRALPEGPGTDIRPPVVTRPALQPSRRARRAAPS
jgi:hypothetical protein